MSNVNLICSKSFSSADGEIVDRFLELLQSLSDANLEKLDEIISPDCDLKFISGDFTLKNEFLSAIDDGTLTYLDFQLINPTILSDGDEASLIANVRLNAKINGCNRRWISSSVVSFQKVDGKWCLIGWDN